MQDFSVTILFHICYTPTGPSSTEIAPMASPPLLAGQLLLSVIQWYDVLIFLPAIISPYAGKKM